MLRVCLLGFAVVVSTAHLTAALPPVLPPLATISPVPCSKRPGLRSTRSGLVQFRDVTISLGGQASREADNCVYSAALSITQKDVSQQIPLPRPETNTFSIVDIAPDASSVLLYSDDGKSAQIGAYILSDGALKWMPVSELLGVKNCDLVFEPRGFLDAHHIVLSPGSAMQGCTASAEPYSVDLDTHRASPFPNAFLNNFKRTATSVSGPLHSCKTDPDVIRACYTSRARLGLSSQGDGLVLWQVGTTHLFAVKEGMAPDDLRSEISPEMRVYATMVICPVAAEVPSRHPLVCVDSASDPRLDPQH